MTRVSTTNYAGAAATTFFWATSSGDRFNRELDLYKLAQALELHDHNTGKGLAVARVQNALINTDQIAAGAVTAAKMAVDTITAVVVAIDAIGALELANDAVDTAAIANLAVTLGKLATDSVDASKIVAGAVGNAELAANAVASANIQAGVIGGTHIGIDQVGTTHYAPGSVDAAAIGTGVIQSSHILDGTIGGTDIGNDQISTVHYAPGSVDVDAIGASSVSAAKLQAGVAVSNLGFTPVRSTRGSYAGTAAADRTVATGYAPKMVIIYAIGATAWIMAIITSQTVPENLKVAGSLSGVNAGHVFGSLMSDATKLDAADGFHVNGTGLDGTDNAGFTYYWIAFG